MTANTIAIIYYAIMAIAVAYSVQQQKKMRRKMRDAEEARKGFEMVVEGEMQPIPIVYGRAKVGGVRVWHATNSSYVHPTAVNADKTFVSGALTSSVSGNTNSYLYFQQVLCLGPINACYDMVVEESRWLDDPSLNSGLNYDQPADQHAAFRTEVMLGRVGVDGKYVQQDNATFTANFGERKNAKFPGLAFASTVVKLNREDPQHYSTPMVQYLIEGRLVRPISRQGTNPNYTYSLGSRTYSNNPALCLLDYLLESELMYGDVKAFDSGKKCSINEIDLPSFYEAAKICGQIVREDVPAIGKIWRPTDKSRYITTRDLPLYECNMIVDPSKPIRDNVESMLSAMGDARLVWSQGKYKLNMLYPYSEKTPNDYKDPADPGDGSVDGGTDDGATQMTGSFIFERGGLHRCYINVSPSTVLYVDFTFKNDGTLVGYFEGTPISEYWHSNIPLAGADYSIKFEFVDETLSGLNLAPTNYWTSAAPIGEWITLSADRQFSMAFPFEMLGANFNFLIHLKHNPSGYTEAFPLTVSAFIIAF